MKKPYIIKASKIMKITDGCSSKNMSWERHSINSEIGWTILNKKL
jgi:hypothetical protein